MFSVHYSIYFQSVRQFRNASTGIVNVIMLFCRISGAYCQRFNKGNLDHTFSIRLHAGNAFANNRDNGKCALIYVIKSQ